MKRRGTTAAARHFEEPCARRYLLRLNQTSSDVDILGIDIGGSGVKGAPVDLDKGKLSADRFRIDTPRPATPKAVSKAVTKVARHFDWKGPIGCTLPARVMHGVAKTAANIHKSWIDTPVEWLFEDATGCKVRVLNDADAAGVAAMTYGAGRGHDGVVIMLTIGTGIGSALFVDGHLVPNTEFGHLELNGQDAEKYAADSARKRDDLTWEKWAGRFQEYLDLIEFLLAPDLIIIGGGASRPKKTSKYLHLLDTSADLIPAELENEAGIIGAAATAGAAISAPSRRPER